MFFCISSKYIKKQPHAPLPLACGCCVVCVRVACWPSLARWGSQGNPDVGDYHLTQRVCAFLAERCRYLSFPMCCPQPALCVAARLSDGLRGGFVPECQCSRFRGKRDGRLCGRFPLAGAKLQHEKADQCCFCTNGEKNFR